MRMHAGSLSHGGGAVSYSGTPASAHAGRLRYANPKDLPSFPSVGLKDDNTAASAAASLGWQNQKQDHRSSAPASASSPTPAAAAASMLSKQRNNPGSRAAALLAAESAGRRSSPHDKPAGPSSSTWGSSAASQAFRAHAQPASPAAAAPQPQPHQPMAVAPAPAPAVLNRQRSLRAAKGAMAKTTRPRSASSPQPGKELYPDQANAAANALSAATLAHRPSMRAPADDAGAVPYTTMDRQMFTSHPPVKPEMDEQQRADVIHASAVAMAKRMYNQQQRVISAAKQSHGGGDHGSEASEAEHPLYTTNLQEAAYKMAQDRLAKLHEEHQKNRDLKEYYGNPAAAAAAASVPQRKNTIRTKLRRRSSSDGAVIEDRRRSQQIRQQMSLFSSRLSEVDEQKRQRDRQALLAIAQKNVKAQLEGMDQKVYAETGKVTPAKLSEWELKAHAAAHARSEARRDDNAGKIDLGGGMFMDPKDVGDIAAKRVQPLLDEINAKAAQERERQAALKAEEEARKLEEEKQKARDREVKENLEKLKHQQKEKDKLRKEELKHEEKVRKEEEKAAKAEQHRLSKEEKRKAKEAPVAQPPQLPPPQTQPQPQPQTQTQIQPQPVPQTSTTTPVIVPVVTQGTKETKETKSNGIFHRPSKLQIRHKHSRSLAALDRPTTAAAAATAASPDESTSPTSKVKNWIKSRFTRPRAQSSVETGNKKSTFIGGHALMHADGTESLTSLDKRSGSMREVALAGRIKPLQPTPRPPVGFDHHGDEAGSAAAAQRRKERQIDRELSAVTPVSSLSGSSGDEEAEFVTPRSALPPPRAIRDPAARKSGSPVRDSRFLENLE